MKSYYLRECQPAFSGEGLKESPPIATFFPYPLPASAMSKLFGRPLYLLVYTQPLGGILNNQLSQVTTEIVDRGFLGENSSLN